jgi:hypothetical protein
MNSYEILTVRCTYVFAFCFSFGELHIERGLTIKMDVVGALMCRYRDIQIVFSSALVSTRVDSALPYFVVNMVVSIISMCWIWKPTSHLSNILSC